MMTRVKVPLKYSFIDLRDSGVLVPQKIIQNEEE